MGFSLRNTYSHFLIHDAKTDDTVAYLIQPRVGKIDIQYMEEQMNEVGQSRVNAIWKYLTINCFLNTCFLDDDYMYRLAAAIRMDRFDDNLHSLFRFTRMDKVCATVDAIKDTGIITNGVIIMDIMQEPHLSVYLYHKIIPLNKIAKKKKYEPLAFYNRYILKRDKYMADPKHIMD